MNYTAYQKLTVVIKISGKVVGDEVALRLTLRQLIELKKVGCRCVLIHGGGDQIDDALDAQAIAYHKIDGVRFTTAAALPVVKATLVGVNSRLVALFEEEALAQGVSFRAAGVDQQEPSTFTAEVKFPDSRTGQIRQVDGDKLRQLVDGTSVPILHSICPGSDGDFNVNADEVALAVAESLGADRLIVCSNTCLKDRGGQQIARIDDKRIDLLVADGTIYSGGVVKILACKAAILSGRVAEVVIVNGRDGSLVKALANDPMAGTCIVKGE